MKETAQSDKDFLLRSLSGLRRGAALSLIAVFPLVLPAGEYYLKEVIAGPISHPECWVDSNGSVPAEITSEDILHIEGGKTVVLVEKSPAVEHDGAFHLGAVDGSSAATVRLQNNVTFGDLRWHSGLIQGYRGSLMQKVSGSAVLDNAAQTHKASFVAGSSWGGLLLTAALSCSESGLDLEIVPAPNKPAESLFVLGGDNSAFHGRFLLDSTVPLELASVNALGAPSVSRADALSVVKAGAVLSVKRGITPNVARGIAIEADGFRICATNYVFTPAMAAAYEDCSSFELPMPISGSYGFTKDGDGTVTLGGAYTAGEIVVANGTLDIAATATFPDEQVITVRSGATLVVHQDPDSFSITCEEGGTVERVIDPLSVTYDAATATATALTRSRRFNVPAGCRQPVSLSSAIALPLHDGLRLNVLTVAAGADALSPEDFEDTTEKTYGLPKTAFAVETDADGVQHVYLVARPVVKSLDTFGTDLTINGGAAVWSDTLPAHEGVDYLLVHPVAKIGNEDFAGDSLTVAGAECEHLYTRGHSKLPQTVLYPPLMISQYNSSGGGKFDVTGGDLCIAGAFGDDDYVTFASRYKGSHHRLFCRLTGEGPLKLLCQGVNVAGEVYGNPQLLADNSGYSGRMYVTQSVEDQTEENAGSLTFNSPQALGGAPEEFKHNALILDRYSRLNPTATMTLETENRGIYGLGPFSFDIPDGVELTVKQPLRLNDTLFKHGAGTLALGGALDLNRDSGDFYVRAGGVAPLADAAVAGLSVTFSNATKIVVRSDAALATGFAGIAVEDDPATGAAGTVSVVPADGFERPARTYATAALCTVPSETPDLTARFVLSAPRGARAELVKEDVTVGDAAFVRYSVKYSWGGFMLVIR